MEFEHNGSTPVIWHECGKSLLYLPPKWTNRPHVVVTRGDGGTSVIPMTVFGEHQCDGRHWGGPTKAEKAAGQHQPTRE